MISGRSMRRANMANPSCSRRNPISRPCTMGSQNHRPTPPPLSTFRRHLFSSLLEDEEGGEGGAAAALVVVLVLALSPPGSAAESRSPSPVEEVSPEPDAPSPSRSTLARAAGGQRRRRWMRANPRPRGGTADRRIEAAAPREATRLRRGRRSDRDGDAMGRETRVSAAAAEAMGGGAGGEVSPEP